jgi:hypothetical protein
LCGWLKTDGNCFNQTLQTLSSINLRIKKPAILDFILIKTLQILIQGKNLAIVMGLLYGPENPPAAISGFHVWGMDFLEEKKGPAF